jgi:hypothetical protein
LFAEFLQRLFQDGDVVFPERPHPADEHPQARAVLEQAYATYQLDVAGPPLPFDAATALAAAELTCWACWFLFDRNQPENAVEERVRMPGVPCLPAQHLSADLVLRYLPQVYRRARARAPDDRLTALLAAILRQWPLSGVLSDVTDPPLTPPEFGGHPGLMLLYAERLARHEKSAWKPQGEGLAYVKWVSGRAERS